MFFYLVTFEFLSHHLLGKGLGLSSVSFIYRRHSMFTFPWYIVGGIRDLIVSVLDHCPLQFLMLIQLCVSVGVVIC